MRRAVLILYVILMLPVVAFARQDDRAVWDLSELFTVTDGGFQFYYPAGWLYDASNGLSFAETSKDLKALTDNDDSTNPSGAAFKMTLVSIEEFQQLMDSKNEPTLDEIADWIVETTGIVEQEARVEVPVMARRSVVVLAEDAKGLGIIYTLWRQADSVMVATLLAPDYQVIVKHGFSWGQLLSTVTPTNALELSDNVIDLTDTGLQVNYPAGWYPKPEEPGTVVEFKSDFNSDTPKGIQMVTLEATLSDMGLSEDATLDDLVQATIEGLALQEPVRQEEFIIAGQPAVMLAGTDGENSVLFTEVLINDQVVIIAARAVDGDRLTEFEPTFLTILQSVTQV